MTQKFSDGFFQNEGVKLLALKGVDLSSKGSLNRALGNEEASSWNSFLLVFTSLFINRDLESSKTIAGCLYWYVGTRFTICQSVIRIQHFKRCFSQHSEEGERSKAVLCSFDISRGESHFQAKIKGFRVYNNS